jgi:hypothetical protein
MKKANIRLCEQSIESLTEYKYLGIKLNESLSWKPLYEAKLKTLKLLKASIGPLMYKLPLPGRIFNKKKYHPPENHFRGQSHTAYENLPKKDANPTEYIHEDSTWNVHDVSKPGIVKKKKKEFNLKIFDGNLENCIWKAPGLEENNTTFAPSLA